MSVIDWIDGVTPLNDANLSQLEQIGRKGVADGYPPLDSDGKIPPQYLPPNGGVVIVGEYTFTTSLSGDPGSGKAGTNNADQTLATLLSISEQTGGGIDVSAVLASLVAGERIYFQDKLDSSHYRLYDVTAVPTDAGAYRTIPVTFNKGAFANFANNAKLIVGIQRLAGAAGGGGGGGLDWEGAWAAGTAYVKGDVVTHQGVTYGAVNDSTGQTPPTAAPIPGAGPVPLVTALPTSGLFDGMEVILVDSLTAPTYSWRLRHVAAKATNKWIFVGGSPALSEVAASDLISSLTYVGGGTPGPSFTIPVAGDYLIRLGASHDQGANTVWGAMSYAVGAAAAADADATFFHHGNSAGSSSHARTKRKDGLAAATVLVAQFKVGVAGNVTFKDRWMEVTPVAVGG